MTNPATVVRVLIVDDSALVRQVLARRLASDPGIEVVGTAQDPFVAREIIACVKPDVITLDIEMPRMDGLTFLKALIKHYPIPVVILSSLAESGAQIAVEALELGAVDVFAKPKGRMGDLSSDYFEQLIEAIKAAAGARLPAPSAVKPRRLAAKSESRICIGSDKIIAIGGSTGGTEALKTILCDLPEDSPPVLAVLHMPEGFTNRYAHRLNELCAIEVREAVDGDRLQSGLALIARGDHHLNAFRVGDSYGVHLNQGPLICRHRPSVEVLFRSVARAAGANAMGIILTGMGGDGAQGLAVMRDSGAYTIAQDERSCVVFGMPKEAILCGAAVDVLPLSQIASACQKWCAGIIPDSEEPLAARAKS